MAAGAASGPLGNGSHQIGEFERHRIFVVTHIGREVDELGDEFGELTQLGVHVAKNFGPHLRRDAGRTAQHIDVGLQRRQRRTKLVTGIHHQPMLLTP